MRIVLLVCTVVALMSACVEVGTTVQLPKLGRFEIDENSGDTLFHQIADFSFFDQDSIIISNDTFKDKIYISDFFFTTCPDICPIMKTQMLRVYEAFFDNERVGILSYTIDPKHDTPSVLKEFSDQLDIDNSKWKFVTGDKDTIYELGQTSYMASMAEDGDNGFIHSGRFFLIDQNRHIRGAYDGTDPLDVDYLITDIERLLNEK